MAEIRIGHGFDIHPLTPGRDLIIGGVRIEYERGLEGHSDADVLLHAIADALLGAAGLPDIGQHFPPTNPKYQDADSSVLLREVWRMIRRAGFTSIINIDAIIMAEEPMMNPHIAAMKKRIAEVLTITEKQVGIKATTCEKLGPVGRGEGIAASVVCLLSTDE